MYWYEKRKPTRIARSELFNLSRTYVTKQIVEPYLKGESFEFGNLAINPSDVAEFEIRETQTTVGSLLYDFDSGTDVTNKFVTREGKEQTRTQKSIVASKDVFIVHGRDHKPVTELKAMLYEFGLNPIVLHEQPSGSRTIVEKLEKYSDVGYAFIILTPDDRGCNADASFTILESPRGDDYCDWNAVKKELKFRSRQNVILEFGYFMGLLGRDRVCCLHKGNVELPSDMHGIVYIPFENSVEEVRYKILKELKAAGYEIKI